MHTHNSPPTVALQARNLDLAYDARKVSEQLNVSVPAEKVTVVIGPNACGKSTLLRALARLLTPQAGEVLLYEDNIKSFAPKKLARQLGLLPQSATAPFGITVADLVARGRFPHQQLLRQWSNDDEIAVERAMKATGIESIKHRHVEELSGGQRQRVWIAMLLAQDAPVMLLDEPTTFLDISHQLDVLELCRTLNRDEGRTIVVVLHELSQAARFADHLIVMKDGEIAATGAPADVLTEELLLDVYGLQARVFDDPVFHTPMIIPISASHERLD
jgi:ABC-type cobalamin/Fe3+-siderophores transport system ATPase subunit